MKRFTALMLIFALAFSLFACGKEQKTKDDVSKDYASKMEESQPAETSKEESEGNTELSEIESSSSIENSEDVSKIEESQPAETSKEESEGNTESSEIENSSSIENSEDVSKIEESQSDETSKEESEENTESSENEPSAEPDETSEPEHIHSYSEPTCTSPEKCYCGAIGASALGHSFSEGQCCRCGVSDPNYTTPSNDTETYTKGLKFGECMWGNGYSVWGIGTATDVNIVIPSTYEGKPVIEIYEGAFKDCTKIKSVSIPSSILEIGSNAFAGCTSLETVSIVEGTINIYSKAFYNCDSLKQIDIPNSIESISKDSFENCDSLKYNEFDSGLYLGNPSNPYVVLMTAKPCKDLFINNKTTIIAHNALSDNLDIKQAIISDSVRYIGRYAFFGCKNLTNVTFGDGLERIYIYAFKNCSALESVVFAESHSWGVNKYGYNTSLTIISTNDASTNAYNLKNKYCEYFWERAK